MKKLNSLELLKSVNEFDTKKINQLLSLEKNEIDVNFASKSNDQMTALIMASFKGNEEAVLALLNDNRTHINAKDLKGKTALEWAVDLRRKNIVNLIISTHAKQQKNNGFDWCELLKTELSRKEVQDQINFKNALLLAIVIGQNQEDLKNSIFANFNAKNFLNQVAKIKVDKLKKLKNLLVEKFEDVEQQKIVVANENNEQNQLSSDSAAISVISFYVHHQENFKNSSKSSLNIIHPINQAKPSSVISQIIDFSQLSYDQKITALEVMNDFFDNQKRQNICGSTKKSSKFA